MQTIPLRAVPSQTLSVQLDGQSCQINVKQLFYGVFVDLYVDNVAVILGVQAENLNRIVRDAYLGFAGDLFFYDTQTTSEGGSDPDYAGFGDRFVLIYLSASEIVVT